MDAAIDIATPATRPANGPVRRGRVTRPAALPASPTPLRRANDETIVHFTSEYLPYARTGGLAEAASGVATEQARSGRRTVVFLPFYRVVRLGFPRIEPVGEGFEVRLGARTETARVHRDPTTGPGRPEVLFVEVGDLFERPSIYGEDGGYPDNHLRFAFFCAAALAWIREVVPEPAVLHPHDWHGALAPVFLRKRLAGDPYYDRIGTVLTVHNAGYQGQFGPEAWTEVGLDDHATRAELGDWHGGLNFLSAGLQCADVVTTVSPSHAAELLTPMGGFGLHERFRGLGDRLKGVLNGIDYSTWDTQTDPWIESNYSPSDLSGKVECKRWLQSHLGLEERADLPLFAMASRLVEQKGIDLFLGGDLLSRVEAQWVFLGEGEQRYRDALQRLAASAPGRISCTFAFTSELEHKVIAGADYLLMPSLYEPCGLTQMRAQRYGTVPLVRRVGGLSDTVVDGVTGFVFDAYEPAALEATVLRAIETHRNQGEWEKLARSGMSRDFSFTRGAKEYAGAYARAATARRSDEDRHMP